MHAIRNIWISLIAWLSFGARGQYAKSKALSQERDREAHDEEADIQSFQRSNSVHDIFGCIAFCPVHSVHPAHPDQGQHLKGTLNRRSFQALHSALSRRDRVIETGSISLLPPG